MYNEFIYWLCETDIEIDYPELDDEQKENVTLSWWEDILSR